MGYWALNTHGDPLVALRQLVKQIWLEADLEGMLVTLNQDAKARAIPRYISDPELIEQVNPFQPLMEINLSKLIPGYLAKFPGAKIGVLLRPCEMRALIEMAKHTSLDLDNLLTISVDCLGTVPEDEYQWRLERLEKSRGTLPVNPPRANDNLALEALAFARQGGIIPYRYRSPCQVCISPAADHADYDIHILGLPVRQQILVSINEPDLTDRLNLGTLVSGLADQKLVAQHERAMSKMIERHARTMERINEDLVCMLPTDVDEVIHQLEDCGECQACMDVCPICSVDRPFRTADGHYDRSGVLRWLVSCAGCGMCEQSCPARLPTAAIFAHIRQELSTEWEYFPGRSVDEPLPLM